MEHYQWVGWLLPIVVSGLNLAVAAKLQGLRDIIMRDVREEFEPRETCRVRHEAIAGTLQRVEGSLITCQRSRK